MTIRKYFGLKRETPCDCGCGQRMPAREDIAVMVDRDSYPPRRYIPGHEPGARAPTKAQVPAKSTPAPSPTPPTPGPAGPTPTPPTPVVEPSPSPAPKPSEGLTSSLADNRPWSIIQVTVSVGPYESVKVGSADFGTENESLAQLRERIAKEVGSELDRQVRSLQVLHQGNTGTTKGTSVFPATLSPAKAGAPQASQSTPASAAHSVEPLPAGTIARGMEKYYEGKATEAPVDLLRQVDLELSDISERRRRKKVNLLSHWLKDYSYTTPEQASADTLTELLVAFERVNAAEA